MFDIKLECPLIFFDLETTGVNPATDRIIEISIIRFSPDGSKDIKTRRLNPEMPIPPEAIAIHGITDADVAEEPTFKAISRSLFILFEGCDLSGYNIAKFDIPLLAAEFKRSGLDFSIDGRRIIDVYNIFCKLYPRSLSGAYKFFCGEELAEAHSAEADTLATIAVFEAQLSKHPELPRDIGALHQFSDNRDPAWIDATGKFKWAGTETVIGFGRNVGIPLKKIAVDNPGFLTWIVGADFPDDAKVIAAAALKGNFPMKQTESANGPEN